MVFFSDSNLFAGALAISDFSPPEAILQASPLDVRITIVYGRIPKLLTQSVITTHNMYIHMIDYSKVLCNLASKKQHIVVGQYSLTIINSNSHPSLPAVLLAIISEVSAVAKD